MSGWVVYAVMAAGTWIAIINLVMGAFALNAGDGAHRVPKPFVVGFWVGIALACGAFLYVILDGIWR